MLVTETSEGAVVVVVVVEVTVVGCCLFALRRESPAAGLEGRGFAGRSSLAIAAFLSSVVELVSSATTAELVAGMGSLLLCPLLLSTHAVALSSLVVAGTLALTSLLSLSAIGSGTGVFSLLSGAAAVEEGGFFCFRLFLAFWEELGASFEEGSLVAGAILLGEESPLLEGSLLAGVVLEELLSLLAGVLLLLSLLAGVLLEEESSLLEVSLLAEPLAGVLFEPLLFCLSLLDMSLPPLLEGLLESL